MDTFYQIWVTWIFNSSVDRFIHYDVYEWCCRADMFVITKSPLSIVKTRLCFFLKFWWTLRLQTLQLYVIWVFTLSCKDGLCLNEFPELPPDGLWLVPGVSAACLSTPDTLCVSFSAGRPFHPESETAANTWMDRTPAQTTQGSRNYSWLIPGFEQAWTHLRIRKHSSPSFATCDQRWWVHRLSSKS